MSQLGVKEALRNVCIDFVGSKSTTIAETVGSNQEALDSESKSSAGDKHETGRAMLQLEMEKAGQQLKEVQLMKLVVEKIDANRTTQVGSLGAVIETEKANYFLGISVGRVLVNEIEYFVVSPNSPIGKLLLGKQKGGFIDFQGKRNEILKVY